MKMRELYKAIFHRTSWVFNISFVAVLFIQYGNSYAQGSYNTWTGEISCTSRETCLHEVAHKYDHAQGWISKTEKYQHSIDVYRMMIWEYPEYRDEYSLTIYNFPGLGSNLWQHGNTLSTSFWQGGWGGYSELFATILQWSDGDPNKCSKHLREFYDWNFINSEMEKLEVENGRFPDFKENMG